MAQDIPPRLGLKAAASLDDYLTRSKLEIGAVLRGILADRAPATVYLDETDAFIVTTLLAVDDAHSAIVFDCGASRAANERLAAASRLTFITSHNRVRVQFECGRAGAIEFEGHPAFRTPLPDALLRLQRREYYRITAPVVAPLKCVVPLKRDGGTVNLELTVLDIGCGGIAASANLDDPVLDAAAGYPCSITLPGMGTVHATIAVRNTFEITFPGGKKSRRSGFEFVDPSENMLTLMQRYVLQEERRHRTKFRT